MWSLLGDDGDAGGAVFTHKCGGCGPRMDPAFACFGMIQED
jgi:hypothetical protein